MSDEYGPYIYKFDSYGALLQAVVPPAAILPMEKDGSVNFTSVTDPKTGRAGNQGQCIVGFALFIAAVVPSSSTLSF